MNHLKVYEVGMDPLPFDGTQIILITTNSSFGMFSSIGSVEGTVTYVYGDELPLEKALHRYDIDLDSDGYSDDGEFEKITVQLFDCGTQMVRGARWMYCHDAYPILDPEMAMPVQDKEYWDVCVDMGWIQIESETDDVYDLERLQAMKAKATGNVNSGWYEWEHVNKTFVVLFMGLNIKVEWRIDNDGWTFRGFEVLPCSKS